MLLYVGGALVLLVLKLIHGAFFSGFSSYRPGKAHGQKKKVVIIGAGVSGIACAKEMMDEGHEVVIYDKNTSYGGLWNFSADDRSSARVYENLITNSSAMVMAFSDHPPTKENFADEKRTLHRTKGFHYTAPQFKEYIDSYIERFGVRQHWRLGHSVQQMTKLEGDRWKVTVRNEETKEEFDTDCDFVCVCTGQHHCPKDLSTEIPGMTEFPGVKIHSREFVSANIFKGKRVVVIGGGDSAADLVKYCSAVSPRNVFHSVRSGAHVIPRYFLEEGNRTPFDYSITRFSMYLPQKRFLEARDRSYPRILNEKVAMGDKTCEQIVRLLEMNGSPERAYFGTKSAMGCEALASGDALLKTGLKEMKGTTAIFNTNTSSVDVDDSPLENVDAVLFCTGYVPRFDFLPTEALATHGHLERYSLMWHPELANVAFIGFARPGGLGAIPPLAEAQSRWAAQVLSGKVRLPSPDHMRKCNADAVKVFTEEKPRINAHSTGHLVVFSYYLAHVCAKINASPSMGKLFFTNQPLFWDLMFKPFTPMQFRLTGPHSCPELAQKTIHSITSRKFKPAVIRNWIPLSCVMMAYNLAAQLGISGTAPGYSDAYSFWS